MYQKVWSLEPWSGMTFSLSVASRSLQRRYPSTLTLALLARRSQQRTFLKLFKTSKPQPKAQPEPALSQDNLFHPFSKSPFSQVKQRGEAMVAMDLVDEGLLLGLGDLLLHLRTGVNGQQD